MDKKSYSASELSGAVGVPRTTINDWLSKYGGYIDSENCGKRRLYGEAAVNVLKEIARMRSEGKNAFEIGRALEARYGVRPEVAHAAPAAEQTQEKPQEAGLPAQRNNSNEAALAAFNEQMSSWSAQIEEMQDQRRRTVKRGFLWLAIMMVLLLGALAGSLYFLAQAALMKFDEGNRELHAKLALVDGRLGSENREREKQLTDISVLLSKTEGERKSELELQKKTFETALDKLSKQGGETAKAEILKLRDEFAASQKVLLEEMVKLREENRQLRRAAAPETAAGETAAETQAQTENLPAAKESEAAK